VDTKVDVSATKTNGYSHTYASHNTAKLPPTIITLYMCIITVAFQVEVLLQWTACSQTLTVAAMTTW